MTDALNKIIKQFAELKINTKIEIRSSETTDFKTKYGWSCYGLVIKDYPQLSNDTTEEKSCWYFDELSYKTPKDLYKAMRTYLARVKKEINHD